MLDASASAPIVRGVEAFVQAENVLNRLYVASAYGYDARGTPRQVFAGLRADISGRR